MKADTDVIQEDVPIFVRGLSRSGGTLMVTMLDAHPEIAMSYELYPNLLELKDGAGSNLLKLAESIKTPWIFLWRARKRLLDPGLLTFLNRCPRGGINRREFSGLLRDHADAGLTLKTTPDRMQFIARCCKAKMRKQDKTRWGLKCTSGYAEYLETWPKAYFLNVVRDGRDVLASQLRTGSFKHSPVEVGTSWARTHRKFRELMANPSVRAYEVRYERLVTEPETELKNVTDFLGIRFSQDMLDYYQKGLTIYSATHLSMERISGAVDATRIGRWRKDLTENQLQEFMRGADGALAEFGYSD